MGKLGLGPVGLALNVSASYLTEAAETERLGYSAIWLPGGQLGDLDRLAALAGATAAGADHVILHVLAEGGQPGPIETARALAGR